MKYENGFKIQTVWTLNQNCDEYVYDENGRSEK